MTFLKETFQELQNRLFGRILSILASSLTTMTTTDGLTECSSYPVRMLTGKCLCTYLQCFQRKFLSLCLHEEHTIFSGRRSLSSASVMLMNMTDKKFFESSPLSRILNRFVEMYSHQIVLLLRCLGCLHWSI